MIIRTENAEFRRIFELLEEEGFIVNSMNSLEKEVVMQKNNIHIELTDLS